MSFQARLPVLLSVSFVVLISIFAGRKLSAMPRDLAAALGAVVLLYLAWLFIESRVAVRELSKEKTKIDRGTLELYAAGRAVTVLSALALPTAWDRIGLWYPIGLAVFVAGVAFRLAAIRVLGRFYSHRVRIDDSHQIVQHGPYRFLRHPAYTGMIVAHVGFVVCFFHPVSLAILLCFFIPAVVLRIRVEERALFALRGYAEYAKTRKRLIPAVW